MQLLLKLDFVSPNPFFQHSGAMLRGREMQFRGQVRNEIQFRHEKTSGTNALGNTRLLVPPKNKKYSILEFYDLKSRRKRTNVFISIGFDSDADSDFTTDILYNVLS